MNACQACKGSNMANFMTRKQLAWMCCIGIAACAPKVPAQHLGITGKHDQMIAAPSYSGPDGKVDAQSARALQDYVAASALDNTSGITLQGDMIADPDANRTRSSATVYIESGNRFRFDIQAPTGNVSSRVEGQSGAIQRDQKGLVSIPQETAMSGAFVTPWIIQSILKDKRSSSVYVGVVAVDGENLIKVTLNRPLCVQDRGCPQQMQALRQAMDLYFAPQTHLLIKSAELIRLSERSSNKSLRVTTYRDYRKTDGAALLPYEYSETINGQLVWEFKAGEVSIGAQHAQSHFRFLGEPR